jgi:hypothetical protein
LRVRVAGANYKIIGKRRLSAHIECFDVVCFDFVASATNEFQLLPAGGFELLNCWGDDFSSA